MGTARLSALAGAQLSIQCVFVGGGGGSRSPNKRELFSWYFFSEHRFRVQFGGNLPVFPQTFERRVVPGKALGKRLHNSFN